MYDCGSIDMVCDFQSVFQDKVNFNIFINEQLEYLRCAKLQDVLHFLKEVIKDQEKFYGKGRSWRRLKPLYKLLKGFNNPQWNVTNKFGTYEMLVVRCEY